MQDCARLILEIIPPTMRFIRNEMRLAAKSELTVPHFRILAILTLSNATNKDLAEWMGVSAPTISRMVEVLVKKGLVKRIIQVKDRRQVSLSLTAKGKSTYSRIYKEVYLKFSKQLNYLTFKQKNNLVSGLNVLREIFL